LGNLTKPRVTTETMSVKQNSKTVALVAAAEEVWSSLQKGLDRSLFLIIGAFNWQAGLLNGI